MRQTADIIIRNFYRMLRSGAMNEDVRLEPMSGFKWGRLADIAVSEGVANVVWRAAKNHQYEQDFAMTAATRGLLRGEAAKKQSRNIRPEMINPLLEKKMNKIFSAERHSENGSKETAELLGIIIIVCRHILVSGVSTRLIIRLGNYIRINASKIDYAKLARWLRELRLARVAGLIGSVLIVNFAFRKEELPFVKTVDDKAAKMMTYDLSHRRGALQSKAFAYFEYAPLENVSLVLKSLKTRLDSIEE